MRTLSALILVATVAVPAFADPMSDARAHDEAFEKACNAGDIPGVAALYADDAIAIWPGAGEEAKGKDAIAKLAVGLCDPRNHNQASIKSLDAVPLDDAHIAIVGHWEVVTAPPGGMRTVSEVRTTEVIAKTAAGWRYVVDHASIGEPAPKPAKKHAHK